MQICISVLILANELPKPKNCLWFQIILVVVWGAVMALICNALR